ncbi:MAG: hypothetical protein AAB706_02095 [Patescibacteria group bacterium]
MDDNKKNFVLGELISAAFKNAEADKLQAIMGGVIVGLMLGFILGALFFRCG